MSFDLDDFFGFIDLPDGVELLREAFDLLNRLEYFEHIDPLEDLLSVSDDYDASTNRQQITEIFETHLLRQLEFRGLSFEEGVDLGFEFLYKLLLALVSVEESKDKYFYHDQVFCIDTISDKEKMIELVGLISDLDRQELEDKVVAVSEDYMTALAEGLVSEPPDDNGDFTLRSDRLTLCPDLPPDNPVRLFLEQSGHHGYPLSRALLVLFEPLQALTDDRILADSLIALVLGSRVINNEIGHLYDILEKLEPNIQRQARVGRYVDAFFQKGGSS